MESVSVLTTVISDCTDSVVLRSVDRDGSDKDPTGVACELARLPLLASDAG